MDIELFRDVLFDEDLFDRIFEEVEYIHKKQKRKSLKWKDILDDPDQLICYNYVEQFKKYFDKYANRYGDNSSREILKVAMENQCVDIVQYLFSIKSEQLLGMWTGHMYSELGDCGNVEIAKIIKSYLDQEIEEAEREEREYCKDKDRTCEKSNRSRLTSEIQHWTNVFISAATRGSVEMMEWAYQTMYGYIKTLEKNKKTTPYSSDQYYIDMFNGSVENAMEKAVTGGNLEVIKWLLTEHDDKLKIHEELNYISENSLILKHFTVLDWIRSQFPTMYYRVSNDVLVDDIDLVTWCFSNMDEYWTVDWRGLKELARKRDSLDVLQFVKTKDFDVSKKRKYYSNLNDKNDNNNILKKAK